MRRRVAGGAVVLVAGILVSGMLLPVRPAVAGAPAVVAPSNLPIRVDAAAAHLAHDWLGSSGIVATGVGRDDLGRPDLLVFSVDPAVAIPASIDGVPTRLVLTEGFTAQSCPTGPTGACTRPVPPGVSSGHFQVTAGTLGALVEDAAGKQYALSNNHVFANSNQASIGDPIVQPGPFDGGSGPNPGDVIGTLAAYQPVQFCGGPCGVASPVNTIDAAIAAVAPGKVQRQTVCGWTPAITTVAPSQLVPGSTAVKKCGRTTGATSGTVMATGASVVISYGSQQARFDGQVVTTSLSQPGDSGSLIVDAGGHPVALLTGGDVSYTIGNPIASVLGRFGVTFDDGIPGPPPSGPAPIGCSPSANAWGTGAVTAFAMPAGDGYWLARANGTVATGGGARYLGDASCLKLNGPVLGGAPTPTGSGYWLNGRDGGVFTFGTAPFFGSMGATALNQPVFSMAATRSGSGYWLVAYDGGIFSFGDAPFHGSTGDLALMQPIIAIATSSTGGGYRLVARDGGIFSFGDVPFFGSLPGLGVVASDVVGVAPTPSGKGYWIIRSLGQSYTFGDAGYLGPAPVGAADPVVAVVANPVAQGYRLLLASGGTVTLGAAPG
jgi:hypothetical protein